MAIVRRIRKRGANIVVEAHGEILFADNEPIGRFKFALSRAVTAAVRGYAPTNKRPRWDHYGKPLKDTFTSSTATRVKPGGASFFVAVGSSAPHAQYVDQGTGIYVGHSPWRAKILPPWAEGSASLYEAAWKVPTSTGIVDQNGRSFVKFDHVAPVFIKGQRGQEFFDKGLKDGMAAVGVRAGDFGISSLTHKTATFPDQIVNFSGATAADGAFKEQLDKWRLWRDEAFYTGKLLGMNHGIGTREWSNRQKKARDVGLRRQARHQISLDKKRAANRLRQQRHRAKVAQTAKPKRPKLTFAQEEQRVTNIIQQRQAAKGREVRNIAVFDDHTWAAQALVDGRWVTITGKW